MNSLQSSYRIWSNGIDSQDHLSEGGDELVRAIRLIPFKIALNYIEEPVYMPYSLSGVQALKLDFGNDYDPYINGFDSTTANGAENGNFGPISPRSSKDNCKSADMTDSTNQLSMIYPDEEVHDVNKQHDTDTTTPADNENVGPISPRRPKNNWNSADIIDLTNQLLMFCPAEELDDVVKQLIRDIKNCSKVSSPKEFLKLCDDDDTLSDDNHMFPNATDMYSEFVEWMQDLCTEVCLNSKIYYLALDYVVRFLQKVATNNMKLLGIACVFLATKIESRCGPSVYDFINKAPGIKFEKAQILKAERLVMQVLEYKLVILPEGESMILPEEESKILPEDEGKLLPEEESMILPEEEGKLLPEEESMTYL